MFEVYLFICFLGLIFLIIFAILGGFTGDVEADVDVGDVDVDMDVDVDVDMDVDMDVDADVGVAGHPSPLSLPLIFLFMTTFGAFGAIFEMLEFNWMLVPIMSGVISILIAAGMFMVLVKIFASTESTSMVSMRSLIGMQARVTVPIVKGGQGQIVISPPNSGRMLIGAIADRNIPRDTIVEVQELVGDMVKVRKPQKGKTKKKQAIMK